MKPSYEELEEQLNRSRRLCDAALAAERVWETAMMQACGEDGPKSVADKFAALEQRLIESERYGRQTDITIDNLEMKLAQMAAENAGLNEKVNKLATWPGIEFYSSAWEFNNGDGNAALEYMCDTEAPATDAFLAEVRAQGVDAAIEHLINKFEGTGRIGVPVMALEWLAKDLRK